MNDRFRFPSLPVALTALPLLLSTSLVLAQARRPDAPPAPARALARPAAAPAAPPAAALPASQASNEQPAMSDYIVAVVNQEPVTHTDIDRRVARIRAGTPPGTALPEESELRQQVLDALIDEKAQLQFAKAAGMEVNEAEIDATVEGIAAQNQMTVPELRQRMAADGVDYQRYRSTLREQLLLQRVREREVNSRIHISDNDIDDYLQHDPAAGGEVKVNLAHILVGVPEKATAMEIQLLRSKALDIQQKAAKGADFAQLAAESSDDARTRNQGGALGLRPINRYPDLFANAAENLKEGQVTQVLRSPAGFHIIKLLTRESGKQETYTQQHAEHILLRASPSQSQADQIERLKQMREQVLAGKANFEQLARQHSEDGSASRGGDLGWASPGQFVPEFEKTMNGLQPGQVSEPLVSRFGVHLIKLLERREVPLTEAQKREAARNILKERRFESTYEEWAREMRGSAWVEVREAP